MCADYLAERGCNVYRASRSLPAPGLNDSACLHIDITRADSVNACVRQIAEKEGRIDVVLNCAGYGIAGSIEDTSIEEVKAQFETNFFGAIRVCQAVLPLMRQQQAGLIVHISSIGGLLSLPFQGIYCASKFALEGAMEALRMEVSPFGIRVVLIEPGDLNTPFTAHRRKAMKSGENIVYRETFEKALSAMERYELNGPSPLAIAHLVERIINKRSPSCRYVRGSLSERAAIIMRMFLPSRVYERLLMKHYE